jgi:hypothetical protein
MLANIKKYLLRVNVNKDKIYTRKQRTLSCPVSAPMLGKQMHTQKSYILKPEVSQYKVITNWHKPMCIRLYETEVITFYLYAK